MADFFAKLRAGLEWADQFGNGSIATSVIRGLLDQCTATAVQMPEPVFCGTPGTGECSCAKFGGDPATCERKAEEVAEAAAQADDVQMVAWRWKWKEGALPESHPKNGWHLEMDRPYIHSANENLIVVEEVRIVPVTSLRQPSALQEDEQEHFEALVKEGKTPYGIGDDLRRYEDGYENSFTDAAWWAWQARAALRQPGALPDEAQLDYTSFAEGYTAAYKKYSDTPKFPEWEPLEWACWTREAYDEFVAAKQAGKETK